MKISARVRANRANAKRSSGPKSAEGKSRVAQNARRHGLAIPVELDPAFAPEIERLTLEIAGDDADNSRLQLARRIAEAQIDLVRIRKARQQFYENPNAQMMTPLEGVELTRVSFDVKRRFRVDDAAYYRRSRSAAAGSKEWVALISDTLAYRDVMNELIKWQPGSGGLPKFAEKGFAVLAPEMVRLDRYERRALSRRRRAIREFDELAPRGDV